MKIKQIYDEFISDETILTLLQLAKKFDYGSHRKYDKLRALLYEEYGKENIKHISSVRMAKYRNKIRNSKPVKYSEESKHRMSKAQTKKWETASDARYEIARASMLKNAAPLSQTIAAKENRIKTRRANGWTGHTVKWREAVSIAAKNRVLSEITRRQMSESAKARGNNLPLGFTHSKETLAKMSDITSKRWKDGKFKFVSTSKGQTELYEKIKEIYSDAKLNHFIDGRPFDIFIPSKNILIEFNGTYWHYDPRKFDGECFDKSKNRYAKDVWKIDEIKIKLATSLKYKVYTVWQLDWETQDKNLIVKELLK